MYQKVIKYIAIGLLILLGLSSFAYNAIVFINGRDISLMNKGALTIVQQITQTVQTEKKITLPIFNEKGEKTGTIDLILNLQNGTKK